MNFKFLNAKWVAGVETTISFETSSEKRFHPKSKNSGSKSKWRVRIRRPTKQNRSLSGSKKKLRFHLGLPRKHTSKHCRRKVEIAILPEISPSSQVEPFAVRGRRGNSAQDFTKSTHRRVFGPRSVRQFRPGFPQKHAAKPFRFEIEIAIPLRTPSKTPPGHDQFQKPHHVKWKLVI